MKKIISFMLLLVVVIGIFPKTVMADSNFDEQLTQYLSEVSTTRGVTVAKEDLEYTLSLIELSLDDFDTVEELKDILGEVINSDYSNLNTIYELYTLDRTSLDKLLADNGETIDNYIFVDELSYSVYFYSEGDVTQESDFETKLLEYLTQVSEIRGFEVSKNDLVTLLDSYEYPLEDFETVDEIRDFMGDVIKADLSNLSYFEDEYDLDRQSLLDLLAENDKNIDNFIYMDDLEQFIWTYGGISSGLDDIFSELLPFLMEELGIDETEINNLVEHLASLEEYLSSPEVEARYLKLMERFSALAETITDTPTNEQIDELISLYQEMFSIFKLEAEFYVDNDGDKTPVTFAELLKMTDLGNGKLVIVIYNTDGEFLLDLSISNEIFQSIMSDLSGYIEDTKEEIIDKAENIKPVVKPDTNKTVKGGELPVTATNTASMALAGIILLLAGALVIWKTKELQNGKN